MNYQILNKNDLAGEEVAPIVRLLTRYVFWSLSSDEHDKLDEWVAANDDNMLLFEDITNTGDTKQALNLYSEAQAARMQSLKKLREALHF